MLEAILILALIFRVFGGVDEIVVLERNDIGRGQSPCWEPQVLRVFDQPGLLWLAVEVIAILVPKIGRCILLAMSQSTSGAYY